MTGKIVVMNPRIDETQKEKIKNIADKYGRIVEFYPSVKEAVPNLEGAEIVFGNHPALITNAPDIKWFCSASAGIDHYIRAGAFEGRDIILTNSSGSFGMSISEYIIMMSLYMMRRMPEYRQFSDYKEWAPSYLDITTLFGSKVVVLGTGDLGSTFAKKVQAFGPASLIGVSKSGQQREPFQKVVDISQLSSVIEDVDLLVMCLPGTPETENILSEEIIAKMPKTAYIVNVGRGSAINDEALIAALEEGRLAGACLDVLREEPLPGDSPLWNVKNLIITPHISGQETTQWTRDNNYNMFCEDLENYFQGLPLVHLADYTKGY